MYSEFHCQWRWDTCLYILLLTKWWRKPQSLTFNECKPHILTLYETLIPWEHSCKKLGLKVHWELRYIKFSLTGYVSHMALSATNIYALQGIIVWTRGSPKFWFFLLCAGNVVYLMKIPKYLSATFSCSHKFCTFKKGMKWNI